jgi:hypothetical protein
MTLANLKHDEQKMDLQLEKEDTFKGNAHTMLLLSSLVDAFST